MNIHMRGTIQRHPLMDKLQNRSVFSHIGRLEISRFYEKGESEKCQ
jgi:hypothetical protein